MERYESDVEEEKGASGGSGRDARHQVIIRLSEGFLEEIEDVSGKVDTLINSGANIVFSLRESVLALLLTKEFSIVGRPTSVSLILWNPIVFMYSTANCTTTNFQNGVEKFLLHFLTIFCKNRPCSLSLVI